MRQGDTDLNLKLCWRYISSLRYIFTSSVHSYSYHRASAATECVNMKLCDSLLSVTVTVTVVIISLCLISGAAGGADSWRYKRQMENLDEMLSGLYGKSPPVTTITINNK